jgi:hypothetical protein
MEDGCEYVMLNEQAQTADGSDLPAWRETRKFRNVAECLVLQIYLFGTSHATERDRRFVT